MWIDPTIQKPEKGTKQNKNIKKIFGLVWFFLWSLFCRHPSDSAE
jgi:hypothetical protein